MKRKLFRLIALFSVFTLLLPTLLACGDTEDSEDTVDIMALPSAYQRSDLQTNLVCIAVKDYGNIIVLLRPDQAPVTVQNFKDLVASGFYKGKTFHRIIEDFMIQGGAPAASDPPPATIRGEFFANGVDNQLRHERGAISMARADDYNSASSQFFIVHKTEYATHLNGLYAAFGYVVIGMNVVDAIATLDTNYSDAPLTPVVIADAYFVTEAASK